MTQRALKKKTGSSVRPFQQSYTVCGLEDDVWDACTYTFGSQENLNLEHPHLDDPRRRPPPSVVAKPTGVTFKSRSTDPHRSSSVSSSTLSSVKSSGGRGGIFSLFKLKKKNKQDSPLSVDTRFKPTTPTSTPGSVPTANAQGRANPASSNPPPVLHLKKTTVRSVSGETEDHFAIVPADKLNSKLPEEKQNVSSVCSRGWELPSVDKTRERLAQLKNTDKVNGRSLSNHELNRDIFDRHLIRDGCEQNYIHLQRRANQYVLPEGEEVLDSPEVEEDDSGKGASLVNSTSASDESSALNSLDISGYIEWEDEASHLTGTHNMDIKRRSLAGPYDMSMEYPPNGMQFSTMPHRLYHSPHLVPMYQRQSVIYDTPTVTHKRKVLKPSSEFILMGPYEAPSSISDDRASSIYSSTMSLAKSRGKFSSMPSLNVLDKESKKMKKFLKEKKKEEKKREKEEKKERKRVEKEMRKSGQTLPRNWEYVKKPIEIVYERPRTEWKLTPVPISLDDEPNYQVPKKTGVNPKMVHYASTPDLLRVAQVYGSTDILATTDEEDESDYAPRAVVLRKGQNGFGFVLRGAKCDSPGLRQPPNDAPAMQYLDTVDKGSVADKAGLKGGDFILEINGKNVTRASHEYVVNLIKTSGTTLTMNVLTVKPTERDLNWYVHQDGSMTLPHRRKQAPEPPRRDPKTSLSFSKAKSKSFAEGMAEIEKLDQALAEYDVSDTPSGESVYSSGHKSTEMKTASIRAGYAKKRVSSVELENLCRSNSPHKPEHLSPSEVRIKKYHKKQSNLEKSQSTPNLAQNLDEPQPDMIPMGNQNQPMYRTVASSGPSDYSPYNSSSCSSGQRNYTQRLHPVPYMGNLPNAHPVMDTSGCRHSVAIGSNVQVNSMPSHARGKARPIAPPMVVQTPAPAKAPAPAPPPQVVKISTNKEQPVYASVVNGAVNQPKPTPQEENPYESSFRPGTVAMFGNKTPVVTQSTLSQVKLRNSKQNDNGQNEKTAQNAMLVTADVHVPMDNKEKQKQRNSSYYEPEPDYDSDEEGKKHPQTVNGNLGHKTVISINNNPVPQTTNGYAPPQHNGPKNPVYSIPQQTNTHPGPSFLPSPDQISLGVGTPINMMPVKSPSSSSSSSYKSTTETQAPTPPPAPPLPSEINSQLIPPPPQFCPPQPPAVSAKPQVSENPNEFLSEIKRVAKERMNRPKEVDDKKDQLEQSSKNITPMDKTQAAILQAVAKRRTMLEQSDKDIVVNQIEAQIQKTKNIQSAKYYNSGNGVKKEIEVLSENKDVSRDKSPSPPIPASKPTKPAVPVVKPSTKPVAPVKPKGVTEKVQNKAPATKTVSVTTPAPAKEIKTTAPPSKNSTAETTKLVEAKVSDKAKVAEPPQSKDDGTDSGEDDFLKKAEKARQMYLKRKSGAANDKSVTNNPTTTAVSTSVNVPATTVTKNKSTIATSSSTKISVAVNGNIKKAEPKPVTNKAVQKTNKSNLEHTKKTAAAPVAKPQLSNGNAKQNRMHIEVQSVGNRSTTDQVGNVSIKDRIASLQNSQNSSQNPVKLITLKGVTTSHSHTDPFSSSDSCSTPNDSPYHEISFVAPPPGFGDDDPTLSADSYNSLPHLHILPAPLSELSISTVPPYDRPTDNLVPQDDSLSLISSLSTLSTLSTSSTEHPIEIVPPPPSGFEDKASPVSTDQGFEESFIPPPPQFDASTKNAASTKNSFRNKPVEDWFYVDVLDWLESVQMHQYKVNFANHCIDGKKLLNLKRNDYITLGVTQVGHRMNLERSIKKLAMATGQKIQN